MNLTIVKYDVCRSLNICRVGILSVFRIFILCVLVCCAFSCNGVP